jgi:hypothetical protein
LGFSGIDLCALLCSLPIIGATLGVGALAAAAAYFEKIGGAVLILSVGLVGYWVIKKKDLLKQLAHRVILPAGVKAKQRS